MVIDKKILDELSEKDKANPRLRHNKKLYNSGDLKPERVEKFKELLALTEVYKRKNQYE